MNNNIIDSCDIQHLFLLSISEHLENNGIANNYQNTSVSDINYCGAVSFLNKADIKIHVFCYENNGGGFITIAKFKHNNRVYSPNEIEFDICDPNIYEDIYKIAMMDRGELAKYDQTNKPIGPYP